MKRLTMAGSIVLVAICIGVWASGIVVGQVNPHEQSGAAPPRPTLQFALPSATGEVPEAAHPAQLPAPVEPMPTPADSQPVPVPAVSPAVPVPPMTQPVPGGAVPMPGGSAEAPATPMAPEAAGGQTEDNPTGRQEPAVSIEWVGPSTVKLGQPASFQVIVKNVSSGPVHQAVVRTRIPAGMTVKGMEPKAVLEGDVLVWDLGTLPAQQEKRLDVQVMPETKGRCACQATVSFTGSSAVQVQVQEPKLVLKATAPEKVLLGDTANIMLTVTNPGDGTADHVKIKTQLSDGLEHIRGKEMEFELGNLGPNESRSVQVFCTTRAGGEQKCEATASAEGNLVSSDAAVFPVMEPKLELAVGGPKLRYLDRQGVFVFRVSNPGNALANNVMITEQIPQGFKFVEASSGGRHDFTSRTVTWFVGDLQPHQSREVNLTLMAVNIGEYKHQATARAARGLQTEAEAETRVEGLSALLIELVDLDDPVEVGANARYELRVTNTGSKTETNIQVVCTLPDKMEFWGAQGAGGVHHRVEGKEVIFEPLPKLAPRADAIYRVQTRPVAPGDVRFRARVKADGLGEPVNKEESTKVFGDEATH